jgi:hypothetical protein
MAGTPPPHLAQRHSLTPTHLPLLTGNTPLDILLSLFDLFILIYVYDTIPLFAMGCYQKLDIGAGLKLPITANSALPCPIDRTAFKKDEDV